MPGAEGILVTLNGLRAVQVHVLEEGASRFSVPNGGGLILFPDPARSQCLAAIGRVGAVTAAGTQGWPRAASPV